MASSSGPLTPRAVAAAMRVFVDLLRAHRDELNRLNVYPVPDGDTGTNLTLTVDAVVAELDSSNPDVYGAIGKGSLMGARGSSGIILAQALRGLCGSLREDAEVGGPELAQALTEASRRADAAISDPVEGTILTVARESARHARNAQPASLGATLDAAVTGAENALARTPEMLPALAEAGVVDAGGKGYTLLLYALRAEVTGVAPPAAPPTVEQVGPIADMPRPPHWEVVCVLEADADAIDRLRRAWDGLGVAIVIAGGEGIYKCHIHTDDPEAAVAAAEEAGSITHLEKSDLVAAVHEAEWVRERLADSE